MSATLRASFWLASGRLRSLQQPLSPALPPEQPKLLLPEVAFHDALAQPSQKSRIAMSTEGAPLVPLAAEGDHRHLKSA